jgi:hypothetical protein
MQKLSLLGVPATANIIDCTASVPAVRPLPRVRARAINDPHY